jgi:hypothetical protein
LSSPEKLPERLGENALDDAAGRRLWEISARLAGIEGNIEH